MARVKKLKIKQVGGVFSDYVHIGADAENIDLNNGSNVQESIDNIEQSIENTNAAIPTKVSQLENDAEYIDKTINNLDNYYTKEDSYTKEEINNFVSELSTGKIAKEIVEKLPSAEDAKDNIIYLLPNNEGIEGNAFDEYMLINDKLEKIGTTRTDLNDYAHKLEVDQNQVLIRNAAGHGEPDSGITISETATADTLVKRTSTGIVRTATPVAANDATNKDYVDSKVAALHEILSGTIMPTADLGKDGDIYILLDSE